MKPDKDEQHKQNPGFQHCKEHEPDAKRAMKQNQVVTFNQAIK